MKIDSSYYNSLSLQKLYQSLSSAKRINTASDDASGLSISQKIESELRSLDRGSKNTNDAVDLVKTVESSLESIHDSLQRMKELSVKASNDILTSEDKFIIQDEINQLKQGIKDISKNTEFNTIKLLNGTFSSKNIQTSPNGGFKMNIDSAALENLGIENFDVTENFDIKVIDDAIKKVSTSRSNLGALENKMSSINNYNDVAYLNQLSSKSNIEDADFAKLSIEIQTRKAFDVYKTQLQSYKMDNTKKSFDFLLGKF